jgi:hypothetical protein
MLAGCMASLIASAFKTPAFCIDLATGAARSQRSSTAVPVKPHNPRGYAMQATPAPLGFAPGMIPAITWSSQSVLWLSPFCAGGIFSSLQSFFP